MTNTSSLAEIPCFLDYLVEKGELTFEQKQNVLDFSIEPAFNAKFLKEVVVEMGYVSKGIMDQAMIEHSLRMAHACANDIELLIMSSSKLVMPVSLEPEFGRHNQVNLVAKNINQYFAAEIAADVAKLIVLLANQIPAIANKVQKGVLACRDIATTLVLEDYANISSLSELIKDAKDSLIYAARVNKVDQHVIADYVHNRFLEISYGVDLLRKKMYS